MLRLRLVHAEAAALRRVHSGQTGLDCSAELRVAQAGGSGDAGLAAGICTVAESGDYVEGLAACKACLLALAADAAFASGAALPEVGCTPERRRHVQASCSWRCAVYIDLEAGGIRLSRTGVAVVQCARAPRRGVVRVSAELALAFALFWKWPAVTHDVVNVAAASPGEAITASATESFATAYRRILWFPAS